MQWGEKAECDSDSDKNGYIYIYIKHCLSTDELCGFNMMVQVYLLTYMYR